MDIDFSPSHKAAMKPQFSLLSLHHESFEKMSIECTTSGSKSSVCGIRTHTTIVRHRYSLMLPSSKQSAQLCIISSLIPLLLISVDAFSHPVRYRFTASY